jgi:hypothetical protein
VTDWPASHSAVLRGIEGPHCGEALKPVQEPTRPVTHGVADAPMVVRRRARKRSLPISRRRREPVRTAVWWNARGLLRP